MGSRLVAATLAVALLGCGGAEKKRAPAPDEEVVIDADSVSSFDCQAAADDFGRKLSELQARGTSLREVRIDQVTNEVGPGLDPAMFKRIVAQRLTDAGFAVLLDGGETKAEGSVTLTASKEQLDPTATRYHLGCQLTERATGQALVTTRVTLVKTKE